MDKEKNLTRKEQMEYLEQKPWYRLLKVLAMVWVALAFFVGFYYSSGVIDGFVNAFLWIIIILIIKQALVYIVFGKTKKPEKKELDQKAKNRLKKLEKREQQAMRFLLWWSFFLVLIIALAYYVG